MSEIIGRVKVIGATTEVGATFKKRDLIVTTNEQYPQDIQVQFVQDKCDILNSYAVGQEVKVAYNLRGREWINPQGEKVYFNTVQGWRIEKLIDAPQQPQTNAPSNEQDDLPF